MKNHRIVVAALLIVLTASTVFATGEPEAAAYPTRNIDAIITWGAGGLTDTIARNFIPLLEEQLGTSVIPQNKPGASGAVGSQEVASKAADGYTILFTTTESAGVWNVMGISPLDVKEFKPVILLSSLTPTVAVRKDSPWSSVEDLVADAQARPGEIIAGFAAPGSTGHVGSLLFAKYSNSDFNVVPFGGGADVMAALLGGHIDVAFNPIGTVHGNYLAGELDILATFSNEQIDLLPDVPPLGAIIPGFQEVLPWGPMVMILVNKNTPDDIVETLQEAALEAVKDPAWATFAAGYFMERVNATGDDFWARVNLWKSTTSWLLYESGVSAESPAKFGIPQL